MKTPVIVALSALGGAIAGGTITYITVNKALVKRYEDWANDEIAKVRAHYNGLLKGEGLTFQQIAENPSPEALALIEKGKDIIREMGYDPDAPKEDPSAQKLSIFDQGVDVDDDGELIEGAAGDESLDDPEDDEPYLIEMDAGYKVIDGEPYLISEAEYFENEPEYELDTLTYYADDDTLTDEHNKQIPDVQEAVGERHLHMFKQARGAKKNSLYIRNDDHKTFYEVINVDGSYGAIVLGMTEEELGLKPEKKRPKKMTRDDH